MKRVVLFFILALCATTLMIIPTYANDAVMGRTPEGVYMMNSDQISMISEDIKIYPFKGFADCTFEFYNSGEATEILMGFPAKVKENKDDPMQDLDRESLKNFTAEDESGSLEVKLEKSTPKYEDSKYSMWYTFKVKFDKGEKKVIRNTYSFANTYYSTGERLTGYIIDTGAVWKDKIGHSKVTFFMPGIRPYEIVSLKGDPYFSLEDGEIVWERYDFEPSRNIEVLTNNTLSDGYINSIDDKQHKEKLLNMKSELENIQRSIETMDREELIKQFIDPRPEDVSHVYDVYRDGFRMKAFQRLSELESHLDRIIAMEIGENGVFVNGTIQTFEPKGYISAVPEIKNGRTFVPLRFIVEKMGGDIEWDGELRQITIKNKGKTIVMKVGDKSIIEDGLKKEIDAAPEIVNGRTIVPVRFVAESIGFNVEWFEDEELVLISSKK